MLGYDINQRYNMDSIEILNLNNIMAGFVLIKMNSQLDDLLDNTLVLKPRNDQMELIIFGGATNTRRESPAWRVFFNEETREWFCRKHASLQLPPSLEFDIRVPINQVINNNHYFISSDGKILRSKDEFNLRLMEFK